MNRKPARVLALISCAVALTAMLAATTAEAQEKPRSHARLYYRLGGSDPAARANNRNMLSIRFGLAGNLRFSYSCGRFDIGLSWTSLMNDLNRLGGQIENAVQAGIASLPMYFLQRAQPGLYELFQTYSAKADAMIAASLKTCEEMEAQIRNGQNPYEDWVKLSMSENWSVQSSQGGSIVDAKYNVAATAGTNGVTWLGGNRRGGRGQQPIRLINDLIMASYAVTINSTNVTAGDNEYQTPTQTVLQSRMMQAFRYPSAASRFAQDVLGEVEIATCDESNCPPKAASTGTGLSPKFEAEVPSVEATLTQLMGQLNPNLNTALDSLRAPGVAMSRPVIDALRELPEPERTVALKRLAQEIALARTIDKALVIRSLLLTSVTLPEVVAAPAATTKAKDKIETLTHYIEDLLFEGRVRRELVSNTAEILLDAASGGKSASQGTKDSPTSESRPLLNGRVPQ